MFLVSLSLSADARHRRSFGYCTVIVDSVNDSNFLALFIYLFMTIIFLKNIIITVILALELVYLSSSWSQMITLLLNS